MRLDEISADALTFLRSLPGGYNLNQSVKRNVMDTAIGRGWMPGAALEAKAITPRVSVAAKPPVAGVSKKDLSAGSLPKTISVDSVSVNENDSDVVLELDTSKAICEAVSVDDISIQEVVSANITTAKPAMIEPSYTDNNQISVPGIQRLIVDIKRVAEFNKRADQMSNIAGGAPALI